MASRWLREDEKGELRKVYGNSLDLGSILISDLGGGGTMTLAGQDRSGGVWRWIYMICWSPAVF